MTIFHDSKKDLWRPSVLSMISYTYLVSNSQLRIRNGLELPDGKGDKKYMVYLVKSPKATILYDAWICGGVIVTRNYIVTSAACLEDVTYTYAIAGYKEYVRPEHLHEIACTNKHKKKIVEYCVPKYYTFSFPNIEEWARTDIAVAKVETPYNLNAINPEDGCSYPPKPIAISFFKRWQEPEIDALTMGWGHNLTMRKPSDPFDHNVKQLKYATAHIVPKEICKEAYAQVPHTENNFNSTIDAYMICTQGTGNFDYNGEMINRSGEEMMDGCDTGQLRYHDGRLRSNCVKRTGNQTNVPVHFPLPMDPMLANILRTSNSFDNDDLTRRNKDDLRVPGLCQNDHGGPLVTFVGSREYLIGVASVFMIVGKDAECIGPFLFTSTYCNSKFLQCKLKSEIADMKKHGYLRSMLLPEFDENGNPIEPNIERAREPTMSETQDEFVDFYNFRRGFDLDAFCDKPAKEKGFEMINTKVSWRDHPDGPSAIDIEEDRLKLLRERTLPTKNPYLNKNLNNSQNDDVNENPVTIQNPSDNPMYNPTTDPIYNALKNPYKNPIINPIDQPIYNSGKNPKYNPNFNLSDNLNHNSKNSKNESEIIGEDESIESIVMRDLM